MAEHEHNGHRDRLRAKLDTGALCEHEYLELLLFYAIPRQNTNDLAHRLLAEFGSVDKVLQSSTERLMRVKGVGKNVSAFLVTIGKMVNYTINANEKSNQYPEEFAPDTFKAYIKREYEGTRRERLDLYLLDKNNRIFMRKCFTSKEFGRVCVAPEEIMKAIISEDASGVVMVHNHPVGGCSPSTLDDRTTKKVQLQCNLTNVVLCDHFIYSADGIYSYYESGRLVEMSKRAMEQINE